MSFSCPDKEPPESQYSGSSNCNKSLLQSTARDLLGFPTTGSGAKCKLSRVYLYNPALGFHPVVYPDHFVIN